MLRWVAFIFVDVKELPRGLKAFASNPNVRRRFRGMPEGNIKGTADSSHDSFSFA